MANLDVKVTDFVPEYVELIQQSGADTVFSHTRAAIQHVSQMYQQTWKKFAMGAPIPGAPRIINSADYARSIQLEDSDPMTKMVYTTSQYHKQVEEGKPEVDLKPGLLSGPSARMGKNGPYNIVPFKHKTPGAKGNNVMPVNIYRLILEGTKEAEQKKQSGLHGNPKISEVKRSGRDPSQRAYQWGSRIDRLNTQGQRSGWKSGKYAGMVRMQASTSSARRSKYLTFRTVSVNSDPRSWIIPELDAVNIRQAVLDMVNPIAKQMFQAAMEQDLQ